MSYTEIYQFNKKGNAELIAEVKNSWRGAMAIWREIEKRYLPEQELSRCSLVNGDIKQVWNLFENTKLSLCEKIVLGSTFDNVIVKTENIPRLLNAFEEFGGDNSLKEQAELIKGKVSKDCMGIAWNQTSVNCGVWESEEIGTDEDGEEYYLPYNILKQENHWFLFDDLDNTVQKAVQINPDK